MSSTPVTITVNSLFADKHIDVVYDVTVAYPYNFPQREPELIMGNVPKEVHFHIERHPISGLPTGEDNLKTWCQERWKEKEQRLAEFHKNKMFSVKPAIGEEQNAKQYTCSAETKMYLALAYWTVFIFGIALMLCYSSTVRWFAVIQVIFFVYMGHVYGGFEIFQVDYFNWLFKKKKKQKLED